MVSTAELHGFLPKQIYDSHAHIYRQADLNLSEPFSMLSEIPEVTLTLWRERVGTHIGANRLVGGLFFPHPTPHCDVAGANEWLVRQLEANPKSRGLILITPQCDPGHVADVLQYGQVVGFKPYHFFSSEEDTFEASIETFLPEWAWRMADDRRLIITLHMVKHLALADEANQEYIRSHCKEYPNATLILAHAARGFCPRNMREGIAALEGLDNVWFDTSAVCEAAPLLSVLHGFGPRKLLWGSDFPVCEIVGKCVSAGDSFIWLDEKSVNWDTLETPCTPTKVGLESLLALKHAADDFGLNEDDIQDIFCRNANRLLEFDPFEKDLTHSLYVQAKTHIPGGTQLLSKRPEMMAPNQWPAYFREARGCETWDLDGRRYIDMSTNGIGACLLGFRDPDVTRAVQRRINLGSMSTLNPPEEVALAAKLCALHPWAACARFARTGGEIGAVAVRIARATTKRSLVAVCGYHGWHDWYLAANLGKTDALDGHLLPGLDPGGVPRQLAGTTLTFRYNDFDAFTNLMKQHGHRLAAVVMEPLRRDPPEPGFLERVQEETHKRGALLIVDEITIGWRLALGGAHLVYDLEPDLAIFAKALGNGHPIAAVIGTKEAMEGAHTSFISSTYWTESVGPVAALATIEKMERIDVPAHVKHVGEKVLGFWKQYAEKHGLAITTDEARPCLAHFHFDHDLSEELRTLYTQLMLERGFLAGAGLYATLAHTDEIVNQYGAAIDDVFSAIARLLPTGKVREHLNGPVAHCGFRRLV
ncbi:MAG: aminotransferase class III-fold pyridoxal phosphate-dependent enzyme [Planctomycetes bacterium]|nr:aminotransferase class III-fold pyridoxal phosphate-dependent enzyme [Planctomycetota bacterium]